MNEKQRQVRNSKIKDRYKQIREEFWPEISDESLWKSLVNKHYAALPRALPIVCQILDLLTKGTPVSHVYYSLWCRSSEEAVVIIADMNKLALESGYSGQRAVDSLKARMKKLVDFGFILHKPGSSGDYHYILLLHPYRVLKKLREEGKISNDIYYNTWFERVHEIGATKDIA